MDNKKNLLLIIFMSIIITIVVINIANNSFAYEYSNNEYTLFYKDDYNELSSDINIYLSTIDDYLIPNSSYLYSDILTENYDFLTNFAIDYIINNKEIYNDKIKELTSFTYYDTNYNRLTTNQYIDINDLYDITYRFFGIRDYYIINENINIVGNYVSLSDYTPKIFNANIKKIDINIDKEMLEATIYYDSLDKYKYTFKIINNVLKIYNIEVV